MMVILLFCNNEHADHHEDAVTTPGGGIQSEEGEAQSAKTLLDENCNRDETGSNIQQNVATTLAFHYEDQSSEANF